MSKGVQKSLKTYAPFPISVMIPLKEKIDNLDLKNTIFIILLISNILFIIWYFGIAFNNRFTVDDYWHGYKLKNIGLFDTLIYHYFNQEGSLSHVLFATIPHIFLKQQSYCWIFNLVTFLSLFFSIYVLSNRLFNLNSILLNSTITLFLLNIFFLSISSKNELLFCLWLNFSYTFGISHFIFGIACIKRYKIFSFILLLLFALNKINIAFEGLILLIVYLTYEKSLRQNYWIIIIYAIFLLVNIAAPGNFNRREDILGTSKIVLDVNIALNNILYYAIKIPSKIPFLLGTLGICCLTLCLNKGTAKKLRPSIIYILIVCILIFLIFEAILFSFTFQDSGPERTHIFLECYLAFIVIIMSCRLSWILKNIIQKYKYLHLFLIMCFGLILVSYNITYFKFIPTAIKYAESVDERERIVMAASVNNQKENLVIPPLANSGLLHNVWSEDTIWLNNVYSKYYNLKCYIEIKQ